MGRGGAVRRLALHRLRHDHRARHAGGRRAQHSARCRRRDAVRHGAIGRVAPGARAMVAGRRAEGRSADGFGLAARTRRSLVDRYRDVAVPPRPAWPPRRTGRRSAAARRVDLCRAAGCRTRRPADRQQPRPVPAGRRRGRGLRRPARAAGRGGAQPARGARRQPVGGRGRRRLAHPRRQGRAAAGPARGSPAAGPRRQPVDGRGRRRPAARGPARAGAGARWPAWPGRARLAGLVRGSRGPAVGRHHQRAVPPRRRPGVRHRPHPRARRRLCARALPGRPGRARRRLDRPCQRLGPDARRPHRARRAGPRRSPGTVGAGLGAFRRWRHVDRHLRSGRPAPAGRSHRCRRAAAAHRRGARAAVRSRARDPAAGRRQRVDRHFGRSEPLARWPARAQLPQGRRPARRFHPHPVPGAGRHAVDRHLGGDRRAVAAGRAARVGARTRLPGDGQFRLSRRCRRHAVGCQRPRRAAPARRPLQPVRPPPRPAARHLAADTRRRHRQSVVLQQRRRVPHPAQRLRCGRRGAQRPARGGGVRPRRRHAQQPGQRQQRPGRVAGCATAGCGSPPRAAWR